MRYKDKPPITGPEAKDRLDGGWELENFTKNPKVFWKHDASTKPIGKVLSVGRDENGVVFEIELYKSEESGQDEPPIKGPETVGLLIIFCLVIYAIWTGFFQ